MIRIVGVAWLLWLGFCCRGFAVNAYETLPDPQQEARARYLSAQLRCLVCQNQSIDDSEADLAKDLRKIVREQIAAGASEDQIKSYLVGRYGEFILLQPPLSVRTVLLWSSPFLLVIFGGMVIFFSHRARQRQEEALPLSCEERAELERLLKDNGENGENGENGNNGNNNDNGESRK